MHDTSVKFDFLPVFRISLFILSFLYSPLSSLFLLLFPIHRCLARVRYLFSHFANLYYRFVSLDLLALYLSTSPHLHSVIHQPINFLSVQTPLLLHLPRSLPKSAPTRNALITSLFNIHLLSQWIFRLTEVM